MPGSGTGCCGPVTVHERAVRSALRKANLTGTFVLGKFGLSPSMACAHGCAYCDGRAERYWVEGDFDRDIVVRPNLPSLLAAQLPKLRERGFISIGSGITDAYQPVPAVLSVTRRCAQILAQADHPVVVLTKSALAAADLGLWREVNRRSRFLLVVSLTHSDDTSRAQYEPHASPVEERLETLRAFRAAGCAVGVLAMPLLPGITDTEANLTRLYDRLAEIGVDFVQPGELTLRPGRQKAFYLERIAEHHPGLLQEYRRLYAEERTSGAPLRAYASATWKRAIAHNSRVSIPFLPPHRLYRGLLHRYDELNVLLNHMRELYRAAGIGTARLDAACTRYLEWLLPRKAVVNRRPSVRYEEIDVDLIAASKGSATPAITEIVQNERLASLIRSVVVDRAVFDYCARRLG